MMTLTQSAWRWPRHPACLLSVLGRNPGTAYAEIGEVAFGTQGRGMPGIDFPAGAHAAR